MLVPQKIIKMCADLLWLLNLPFDNMEHAFFSSIKLMRHANMHMHTHYLLLLTAERENSIQTNN